MRKEDSVQSIFKSALHFFSGTLLSRLSGLARDVSMAYAFGATSAVSAFLVAFRFAHLLRRLFGESALSTGFIPIYEEVKSNEPAFARSFFLNNALSLTAFLSALIILLEALIFFLIRAQFFSDATGEILYLTSLMLPSLLFICLFGLNISLLQAEGSFFISSFAPVFFNLVWVMGALFLSSKTDSAMSDLSLIIILACFCQWLATLPALLQKLKILPSAPFRFRFKDVRALFGPVSLSMIGIAATQVNSALDSVFARAASLEGPAYLWYAIRIEQLPLSLFGVALSGAILPPLAREFKAGNFEKAKNFLASALSATAAILLPLTFALLVSGTAIISLIYNYGHFNNEDTLATAYCLYGYAVGLIPQALVMILAPAYYAKKKFHLPIIASITAVLLNVCLNGLFVFLRFGPSAIAFATSLSSIVNVLILVRELDAPIKSDLFSSFWKESSKAFGLSLVFTLLVISVESLLNFEGRSFIDHLSRFSLHGLCFILAFSYFWARMVKQTLSLKRA